MTYVPAKFEVATSNNLSGEAFPRKIFNLDLGVKVTQNVAQYPLNHVTYMYSGTKFEAAVANKLGGDAFTRKFIINPLICRAYAESTLSMIICRYRS